MAFVLPKARVLETTATAGNGPYTTLGAVDLSYNGLASFMSVGDTTYGSVVEPGVAMWTGVITYSATNQVTLTTVDETKGTFGAGSKEIIVGPLAAAALFRDDIAGAIATGGTASAYTVSSHRKYASLAKLDGNLIAFTPHVTSSAGPTLNVDGLGAKAIRAIPSADLIEGVLIQGTPYMVLYSNSDGVFYLHGLHGNPYNVPLAAAMPYFGTSTPNSAFAFPFGQAISRTTYSALFTALSTNFGSGDGSTTFNLPDMRGRVPAGWDAMGGISANRLTPATGLSALFSAGGAETQTLTAGQLPAHTHPNTLTDNSHTHTWGPSGFQASSPGTGASGTTPQYGSTSNSTGSNNQTPMSINNVANTGGGAAHGNVQPSITCNYIMRVL